MSVKSNIQDGEGQGNTAGVTSRHALKVTLIPVGPGDTSNEVLTARKLFRGFLVDSSDSPDLNVNGAGTPVDFTQTAETGSIIAINSVRLLFNGTNLEMDGNDFRRFGNATPANSPLANGVQLDIIQGGIVTQLYITPVVRMGDFYDYADNSLNIKNSISTQSDFLSFDFDFDTPVVLPAGSTDMIRLRVQDDLTAIDLFHVITRGVREVA